MSFVYVYLGMQTWRMTLEKRGPMATYSSSRSMSSSTIIDIDDCTESHTIISLKTSKGGAS